MIYERKVENERNMRGVICTNCCTVVDDVLQVGSIRFQKSIFMLQATLYFGQGVEKASIVCFMNIFVLEIEK